MIRAGWPVRLSALLGALALAACAAGPGTTLYEQLGGETQINAFVGDFSDRVKDNPRIARFFVESDMERFRTMLADFICEISAGPCRYEGDAMPSVHLGLGINDAHFNALVEDLIIAMEAHDVPVSAQNRLLAILAPMHPDIVDPPR
ncbi:MAG: group 1 truncated hemoglobin [Pseudomonadota bacterium]